MENSLKQRIIGAVVLAALAIIFLPAILKEKASNGPFVSQIPEKPSELTEYQIDRKKIDQLVEKGSKSGTEKNKGDMNLQESQSKQKNTKPKQKTAVSTKKPIVNQSGQDKKKQIEQPAKTIGDNYVDAAWVLQVASFSKESNAINLVKKLKKGHFKAYRRKVRSDNSTVFRVFVGPYIEEKKAKKALSGVSKLSESKAIMKPFDPISH